MLEGGLRSEESSTGEGGDQTADGSAASRGGSTPTVARAVYVFAGCAALNSCNLGFDIGVNTDVGPTLLRSSLIQCDKVKLEVFLGSLNFFAIGGATLASVLADQIGRRRSFAVAAVGFILGVALMATAGSFAVLMAGRVFVGLGMGFGLAVDVRRLVDGAFLMTRDLACV
jgi:MFS family permease